MGRIIIASDVPNKVQDQIIGEFGSEVWDKSRVFLELSDASLELREEFERL